MLSRSAIVTGINMKIIAGKYIFLKYYPIDPKFNRFNYEVLHTIN